MERPLTLPAQLAVLAINNQVLLPTAYLRLKIPAKAKKSVSVIESLYQTSQSTEQYVAIFPATTNDVPHLTGQVAEDTTGNVSQLVRFGTAAKVLQVSRLVQSDEWILVVEGMCRISFSSVSPSPTHKHDVAAIQQLEMKPAHQAAWANLKSDTDYQAVGRQLQVSTRRLLQLLAKQAGLTSKRVLELLDQVPQWRAADVVASALTTSFKDRLEVLLAVDPKARVRLALQLVKAALHTLSARDSPVQPSSLPRMPLMPRGNALGGALGRPLGGRSHIGQDEEDGDDDDVEALVQRLKAAGMPPDVLKVALKEVRRLRYGEHQPGSQASRTYLEVLADLPWARLSTTPKTLPTPTPPASGPNAAAPGPAPAAPPQPINLKEARNLLDRAHHGLDKVKERIVQYLAVQKLRGSHAKSPILCFIGPPGVGKTSVARSVAEVLRRPFVRISLGGVRDEAEVRGHRRTYVGALPGRLIQGVKRAGVRDPVMLLDEIDKMGRDSRGDPAAALLEVLDPEQNAAFTDTYLGVPFDLSAATFVATANKASDIPAPLLDRLEVIQLAGYTLEEKVHIAMEHLLPQQLADHGLPPSQIDFPAASLEYLIDHYTREAGVRSLSRALAAICRHVAVQVVGDCDHLPAPHTAEPESYDRDHHDTSARGPHPPSPTTPSAHSLQPAAAHPPNPSFPPSLSRSTLYGSGDIHLSAAPSPTPHLATSYLPPPRPIATGLPYTPDLLAQSTPLAVPPIPITPDFIQAILGPAKFLGNEAAERISSPGAAAGLVWTAVGGMVQYIECCRVGMGQPGRCGQVTLTGQVGEVLEESAQIAMSWIRAHAHELGLDPPLAAGGAGLWQGLQGLAPVRRQRQREEDDSRQPETDGRTHVMAAAEAKRGREARGVGGEPLASRLQRMVSTDDAEDLAVHTSGGGGAQGGGSPLEWDIHVHLPAGAIPKDGPSAGITLAVALLSLLSGRTARADTAMTGELTLRGLVLPVGGIKEKLLAAQHCGMTRVLVPAGNAHEVAVDLPRSARSALEILPMARLEDVLLQAFDPPFHLQPPRSRL